MNVIKKCNKNVIKKFSSFLNYYPTVSDIMVLRIGFEIATYKSMAPYGV